MQRIIVNMQNHVMSDAIRMAFVNNGDFSVTIVDKPDTVAKKCYSLAADTVIMEVTAYMQFRLEERLKIRDYIRKKCPNTKIVFLIDENAENEITEQVKQAKLDGLIDQFIYGSISASYLVALIETL